MAEEIGSRRASTTFERVTRVSVRLWICSCVGLRVRPAHHSERQDLLQVKTVMFRNGPSVAASHF